MKGKACKNFMEKKENTIINSYSSRVGRLARCAPLAGHNRWATELVVRNTVRVRSQVGPDEDFFAFPCCLILRGRPVFARER